VAEILRRGQTLTTHSLIGGGNMLESTTGPVSYSHDMGSIPTATTITSRCHTYAPSAGTGKSGGFELGTSSNITLHITALAN
jgi:hypothetical protein